MEKALARRKETSLAQGVIEDKDNVGEIIETKPSLKDIVY